MVYFMPYLTISGLFVEIWIVCSPEEAHGNENSLVNACLNAGHWIKRSPDAILCWKKKHLHCVQSRRSVEK